MYAVPQWYRPVSHQTKQIQTKLIFYQHNSLEAKNTTPACTSLVFWQFAKALFEPDWLFFSPFEMQKAKAASPLRKQQVTSTRAKTPWLSSVVAAVRCFSFLHTFVRWKRRGEQTGSERVSWSSFKNGGECESCEFITIIPALKVVSHFTKCAKQTNQSVIKVKTQLLTPDTSEQTILTVNPYTCATIPSSAF